MFGLLKLGKAPEAKKEKKNGDSNFHLSKT